MKALAAVAARDNLAKLGIPLPGKPKEMDLKLPDNLDDLSAADITKHMLKWSAMLGYVKPQLALASIRATDLADRLDKRKALLFVDYRTANADATVADLRSMVDSNALVIALTEKTSIAKAKEKLLVAVVEGMEQNYRLFSRELTRRTAVSERDLD